MMSMRNANTLGRKRERIAMEMLKLYPLAREIHFCGKKLKGPINNQAVMKMSLLHI